MEPTKVYKFPKEEKLANILIKVCGSRWAAYHFVTQRRGMHKLGDPVRMFWHRVGHFVTEESRKALEANKDGPFLSTQFDKTRPPYYSNDIPKTGEFSTTITEKSFRFTGLDINKKTMQ